MKIYFPKAQNGDCTLIQFQDEYNINRNILIDGGLAEACYNESLNIGGELKETLEKIKKDKEYIDLLILTHIDDDHIKGILEWFKRDINARDLIKKVWFNSGKLISESLEIEENPNLKINIEDKDVVTTGINEGIDFENYISENHIWERNLIMSGQIINFYNVEFNILSPNKEALKKLLELYEEKAPSSLTAGKKDWDISISEFIENEKKNKFSEDRSVTNGSSISFILKYKDRVLMFLGDSHPTKITNALIELGYSQENPIVLDLLKVSHHGSKNNTHKNFLKHIKSDNYAILTNSETHNHPHKRTLARIISENENAKFHFNYDEIKNLIFSPTDFEEHKNFSIKYSPNIEL